MRAYAIETYGEDLKGLRIAERPVPRPGPLEVVVRIRAASLNYRDLLVIRGKYPSPIGQRSGLIPLSDGAGEIAEIGERVRRVKVGDRVAPQFNQGWIGGPLKFATVKSVGADADGVLAEYVLVGEENVVKLPDNLSFEEAASLPCAAVTAWSSLMCLRPPLPGETVLVQGTGGVSIFALQFAKLFGARVIATTSSDAKAKRLRDLGADDVIDYVKNPEWGPLVRAAAGGRGVDRVVETGGPGTIGQSLKAAGRGGIIAIVGMLAGMEGTISPLQIMSSGTSLHSVGVGSRTDLEQMLQAMSANAIRPVIDRVFPFEQTPEAYRHLSDQRHFGKVVIAGP